MAKKLIEVALPLDEINVASAREKSIRHGHPSTLHLWWARRPLAAARAVIFSSLITDPSDPEYPWLDGQERDVEGERARLHELIVRLVQWENSTNEAVLGEARAEILRHTNGNPPPLLDPFAGGGSIPLEAQRLGLEAHASDLNPVAVLINKAMIEIPPTFAGQAPVNPEARKQLTHARWKGAAGLAEDVRYYGKWMRDEAERRIGHLYPKVKLPKEQGGGEATVVAWLWARTVTCPNPACGVEMPLISSFWLSKKKGKEVGIRPVWGASRTPSFEIFHGFSSAPSNVNYGTKAPKESGGSQQATFVCNRCGLGIANGAYVDSEANAGRMRQIPTAAIAESERRGRNYVPVSVQEVESTIGLVHHYMLESQSFSEFPTEPCRGTFAGNAQGRTYGFREFKDYFTDRQLVALATFSGLVEEARSRVLADAMTSGRLDEEVNKFDDYANAIATYLAFAVSRSCSMWANLAWWQSSGEFVAQVFTRQGIAMVWDFAEVNPFSQSTGNWLGAVDWVGRAVEILPARSKGIVRQQNAANFTSSSKKIIATDPPYYDNVAYADLSDFYYVWLKRSLGNVYPSVFGSILTPKAEEMIASYYRHEGSRERAAKHFETELRKAFERIRESQLIEYPTTIFYAFKQSEAEVGLGSSLEIASTGWETMLEGLIGAGFQITGTWPMRTERPTGVKVSVNALASSVVLVCRVRNEFAVETSRQGFLRELRLRLANEIRPLQNASIAPVDLAQAAIGPGMAIYSQYSKVREATGEPLRVRAALGLINQVLDEVIAEQDEEYDRATRWAVTWYEQNGFAEGSYGDAENLARARDVAVHELANDGLVRSGRGKVRLVPRNEYPALPIDWKPRIVDVYDWQIMQRLAQAAQEGQSAAAVVKAQIDRAMPGRTELAKELAYRVHSIADRKGWTGEALVYNTLVQNWPEIERLARELAATEPLERQERLL